MKLKLISLLLAILSLCISNKELSAQNTPPKMYVVIGNKKYSLNGSSFAKIDPSWLKSTSTTGDGKEVRFYPKKGCENKFYGLLGLKEDQNVYSTVDDYPEFKFEKCVTEHEALELFFGKHLQLPDNLKNTPLNGRVYLYAIVEKNGSLSNIKVNRGIHSELNQLIVECAKKMNSWKPAIIGGEAVRYRNLFGVDVKWLK